MDAGDIIAFTSGTKSYYVNNFIVDGEYLFLNTGGTADIKYNNGKSCYSTDTLCIGINKDINTKYIYYYLNKLQKHINNNLFRGVTIKHLQKNEFFNLGIPIPPLEIQEKTVQILDMFQDSKKGLIPGLKKEVELWNKKYKYHLNELLNFDNCNVEYFKVEDIFKIIRGRIISKKEIKENAGEYPVYSSQTLNNGILGNINTYDYDGNFLTWTTDGAYAGTVFYRTGKFNITNVCGLLELKENKENLCLKYLYYVLKKEAPKYINKHIAIPKLMNNVMAKISIPVPPIEIQEKIVQILDIWQDAKKGLIPALEKEIEIIKKMYKYYLNELLDFKKGE